MSEATYSALEDAIRAHVADETDEDCVATDWYVMIAAEQLVEHATSYLHVGSGSPLHTLHGLVSLAHKQLLLDDDEAGEE